MADVYGTQEVAVKIVAWLDKDTFQDADSFVDKFADDLQKKLESGLKKQKIKIADIVDTKSIDRAGIAMASTLQRAARSMRKMSANDFINMSEMKRLGQEASLTWKRLDDQIKNSNGSASARQEAIRLGREYDELSGKVRQMRAELKQANAGDSLDRIKEQAKQRVAALKAERDQLAAVAAQNKVVAEEAKKIEPPPSPHDLIDTTAAERQLAVINKLKEARKAWAESYKGTQADDVAGSRIDEQIKKAVAAYDALTNAAKKHEEEISASKQAEDAKRVENSLEATSRVQSESSADDPFIKSLDEYENKTSELMNLSDEVKNRIFGILGKQAADALRAYQSTQEMVARNTVADIEDIGEAIDGVNNHPIEVLMELDSSERKLKETKDYIGTMGVALKHAFSSEELTKQIDDIHAHLADLNGTHVKTQALIDIEKAIDDADARLVELQERMERFKATGGKQGGTAFQRLAYDIAKAGKELDTVLSSREQLFEEGADVSLGNATEEYKTLTAVLGEYEAKRKAVRAEEERAAKNAEWMTNYISEMADPFRFLGDAPTQGANSGTKEMVKTLNVFPRLMPMIGDIAARAWDKFTERSGASSKKADELRAKIAGVKKQMDAMQNSSTESTEWKKKQSELKQYESHLLTLYQRQENLSARGVDKQSTAWRNLQSDIERTHTLIDTVNEALNNMNQPGGGRWVPDTNSDAFAKLKEQLDNYQKQLEDVSQEGSSIASRAGDRIAKGLSGALKAGLRTGTNLVKGFFKAIGNGAKSIVSHFRSTKKETTSLTDTLKKAYSTFTTYMRMFRTRIRRAVVSEMFNDMKADFGQMAKVSDDFNKSVSGIINTLKMLGAQILAIAEPVITTFGPMLSYVGDLAAKVADTLAQFMARVTGRQTYMKATKGNYDLAKSMEASESKTKKATKAAKEYKNTVLSFDELHKLNGIDDSSDASAVTGITGAQLEQAQTQASALNDLADRIYNAFKSHDYKGAGSAMADAVAAGFGWLKDTVGWEANSEKITKTLGSVTETINGFISGWHSEEIGAAIGDILNTLIHSLDILTDPENGIDFSEAGTKIGETLASAFANTHWETGGKAVMNGIQGIAKFITGLVTAPNFGAELGLAFRKGVKGMTETFDEQVWADLIKGVVEAFSDFLGYAFANPDEYSELGEKIGNAITKAFDPETGIDREKLKTNLGKAFASIGNIVKEFSSADWGDVGSFFGDVFFGEGGITQSVIDAAYNLGGALGKGILDGMTGAFKQIPDKAVEFARDKYFDIFEPNITGDEREFIGTMGGFGSWWAKFHAQLMHIAEPNMSDRDLGLANLGMTGNMSQMFYAFWTEYANTGTYEVPEEFKNLAKTRGVEFTDEFIGQMVQGFDARMRELQAEGKTITITEAIAEMDKLYEETQADVAKLAIVNKFSDALQEITGLDWKGTGQNVVDGLTSGVNSNANFAASLVNMAIDAYNKVKSFFGINSPSTLMRDEIGQYIPEGIAVGIDSHADAVIDSMESLGDMTVGVAGGMTDNIGRSGGDGILQGAILSGMRQAVMEAAMTMQNDNGADGGDIVLVVDSEELARASARGQRRIDKRVSPTVSFA